MTDQIENNPQQMAAQYALMRRDVGRFWLLVLGLTLFSGAIGWILTKDAAWIIVFSMMALYPLLSLLYAQLYLFNPWAHPATIQRRHKKRAETIQSAPARVLRGNGLLIVATSPFLFMILTCRAYEDFGPLGAVLVGLLGFCFFVGGVLYLVRLKQHK